MAEIWFAGPKNGKANYFNVVRVSGMGLCVDLPTILTAVFSAQLLQDRYFPDASFPIDLLLLAFVICGIFVPFRIVAIYFLRDHVDFQNPYTNYRNGVLEENIGQGK